MDVGISRGLSDNELRVWGDVPIGTRPFGARLSIHNPALWAAKLFVTALKARGISVDGESVGIDFRTARDERFDPTSAIELTSISSRALGEIVRATNKESINLNAELILRTLGRERSAMAGDANVHEINERGDDETGLAIIREWLNRAGIPTDNLALHDGSGLSRLDLVTPETTARLLLNISRQQAAAVFRDSLPVAGTDGTLGGRLPQYKGRITAKTGSLIYDNSLSGFVNSEGEDRLVFSIMSNDQTQHNNSIVLIDQIAAILAEYASQPKIP